MSQGMFAYITVIFSIMSLVAYKFGYAIGRIEEREKIKKEQNEGKKEDETKNSVCSAKLE